MLITTIKNISSETRICQLERSIMIVNKLDACLCDSMELVKGTLSQMNRSEFREDITGTKNENGMRSTKVETIYFGDIIATKDWKNFTILKF